MTSRLALVKSSSLGGGNNKRGLTIKKKRRGEGQTV